MCAGSDVRLGIVSSCMGVWVRSAGATIRASLNELVAQNGGYAGCECERCERCVGASRG